MRAALYLRVSSDEQAVSGHSLDHQRLECRRRAEAMGAGDTIEFVDAGVSGVVLDRPGLDAMRSAVRSGGVDLVVAFDPDRLARRLAHQLILTEEIERRCQLAYVNFHWEATPEGQLFYQLRGAIAEYEREKIRERTMAGRRQKARGGKLPFAVEPYGYRYHSGSAALEVIPEEGRVVEMIFRAYVEQGSGLAAIARTLAAGGVPTKRGGDWHRQTVRQMLSNSVYRGVYYANRRDMSGVGLNRYRASGKTWGRERPRNEWLEVKVPPIVDADLWDDAQRLLARGGARPRSDYLLTGLLTCAVCGLSMGGSRGSSWGRKTRYYTCRRRSVGKSSGCGRRVKAGPLEEAVWGSAWSLVRDPHGLAQALSGSGAHGHDRGSREGEIESIRRRRRQILALVERGAAGEQDVRTSLDRLRRREATLKTAPQDEPAGGGMWTLGLRDAGRWLDLAGRLLPVHIRRRVLRMVVAGIAVGDGRVTLRVLMAGIDGGIGHQQRDQDAPALSSSPQARDLPAGTDRYGRRR